MVRHNLPAATNSNDDTIPWVWLDQSMSTERVNGPGAVESFETNQMEISMTFDNNDSLPSLVFTAKSIFLNGRRIHGDELESLMPRDLGQEHTLTATQEELTTLDDVRSKVNLKSYTVFLEMFSDTIFRVFHNVGIFAETNFRGFVLNAYSVNIKSLRPI
jgi:hypothetical protein